MSSMKNNSNDNKDKNENKGVITDFSKNIAYKSIGNEVVEDKHKEGHSTLCNTVDNSVHHPDNDMAVDTEIKEINFNKAIFTDSIEKTTKELKQNEFKTEESNYNDRKSNYQQEKILCSLDDLNEQNWNQFEENEKLYKVNSTYTEKQYNTEIDLQKVPEQLKKAAEQIEKELKMNKSKSNHINEERGMAAKEDGETEENKYSSVVRNANKNKAKPKTQNKKSSYEFFGFSCWKILFVLFFVLTVFISYRIHKISQRNLIEIENEFEDINIIYESSNIEDENLNKED